MSHNCDHIRQRALKHGEGSLEYDLWIRHSRHCPECRNELYIQELLKGDAREACAAHLSRNDMSRLLQLADEQYRGGRRRKRRYFMQTLYWGGRVAVFGALLFLLYGLLPQGEIGANVRPLAAVTSKARQIKMQPEVAYDESVVEDEYGIEEVESESGAVSFSAPNVAQLAERRGEAFMPLVSETQGNVPAATMVASAAEPPSAQQTLSAEPEMFPGWDVDDAVQGIRRRISLNQDRFVENLDPVVAPAKF